jgi:hypothetical protein
MDDGTVAGPLRAKDPRREVMLEPDEVAAMMRLHRLGWGTRRLADEFGCSRTTVKRYVAVGGWRPFARIAPAPGTGECSPGRGCAGNPPRPVPCRSRAAGPSG